MTGDGVSSEAPGLQKSNALELLSYAEPNVRTGAVPLDCSHSETFKLVGEDVISQGGPGWMVLPNLVVSPICVVRRELTKVYKES